MIKINNIGYIGKKYCVLIEENELMSIKANIIIRATIAKSKLVIIVHFVKFNFLKNIFIVQRKYRIRAKTEKNNTNV